MKISWLTLAIALLCVSGCGSSGSSNSPDTPTDATTYATFGKSLSDAVPAGLKSTGASTNIATPVIKTLTGDCLASYTNCPAITAAGGSDSKAGEILMRLWALDYHSECTTALLQNGTCFACDGCTDNPASETYIKPTMFEAPTSCATTSTTTAHYVNFGIDPCHFDAMVGQISNFSECQTSVGGAVDIASAIPWYASWGIPQTINFSSYSASATGGGFWWTINNGAAGNQQMFLSLDASWLNVGMKDPSSDRFMYFGTGSPTYYQSLGEASGVNIAAYAGTLSAIPARFEALQVRVQGGSFNYIQRITSNGSYLWYQSWSSSSFPATPAAVAGVKDAPNDNRCVQIGASVAASKYVPFSECVTSFGKASAAELNQDSNYTLKMIDGQTASAISFGAALTPTSQTTCLTQ